MCSKVVLTDKITLYMMKNKNIKYYIFVWSKDKKKKLTDRKEPEDGTCKWKNVKKWIRHLAMEQQFVKICFYATGRKPISTYY